MASTSNLQLTLLEGSSVVDYNQLNTWANAIDRLGVDYVVEKGTYGNWWFRVWNSGRCECGVDNKQYFDSLAITDGTKWKPFYVNTGGRRSVFGDYPKPFKTRPYANICFNYCDEYASMVVLQANEGSTTKAPSFSLMNADSYTIHKVQLSIFCVGTLS